MMNQLLKNQQRSINSREAFNNTSAENHKGFNTSQRKRVSTIHLSMPNRKHQFSNSLCDYGANENVMYTTTAEKLGFQGFMPSNTTIVFEDSSTKDSNGCRSKLETPCWKRRSAYISINQTENKEISSLSESS